MALTVETLRAAHAAAPAPEMFGPSAQFRARQIATGSAPNPVTAKQIDYLKRLFAERAGNADAMTLRDGLLAAYRTGGLTSKVASATIKMLTEDDNFKAPAAAAAPATTAPASTPRGGAWANVPDGRYAVTSATGNNDLDFFLVYTSDEEGDWFGMRKVERIIGGNPNVPVNGQGRRAALEAIVAATYVREATEVTLEDGTTGVIPARDLTGPEAAAVCYADEFTRCGRCNRSLTDLSSRIAGIGPVCITKGS